MSSQQNYFNLLTGPAMIPSNNIGKNGDIYISTSTYDLFLKI